MARIVAVANRKGGVGKTTTSLNLAHGLSKAGKRALLVDLDEQHNSTRLYGARVEGAATVFDILTDRRVDPRAAVQPGGELGDIIAGDDLMVRAPEQMAAIDCREFMLADALEPLASAARRAGSFDTVIRRRVKTDDAQRRNVPLLDYCPDCATARDYLALVDELQGS